MNKWAKWGVLLAVVILVGAVAADLIRGAQIQTRAEDHAISGKDLRGQTWDLAEHLGKRPVIVSFFATWCGPCRIEIPHLVEMQQKYRDRGVQIVLVSEEDVKTLLGSGLDKLPLPVLSEMTPAFQRYRVSGIPRTLYFSKDGKLSRDLEGLDEAGLHNIGQELEALPVATASARAE